MGGKGSGGRHDRGKGYTKAHVDKMRWWQVHPDDWFRDLFGENVYRLQQARGSITSDGMWKETGKPADPSGLTEQQLEALRDWGVLIACKLRLAAGLPMTPAQARWADKIGMSIQSANGTGKDFTAAIITWHFMYCFHYPKIIATANTGHQLSDVYWSELAKVRGLARRMQEDGPNDLEINFTMQAESLFANLPNKEERGKRWFCKPVTINTKANAEQQGEAMAGRHEDHMLFVVDEGSGVSDGVFKPIVRTLTGKLNLMFLIFNPTQNTGFAIDSHTVNREKFVCKLWDGVSSPNVTRSSIRNLAQYGKDSPDYRIGVLGLPPLADSDALIPYPWIQAAIGREFDSTDDVIMAAADVGGGGDKSVYCWRQGGTVRGFETFNSKRTDEVADWVIDQMDQTQAAVVFVDIIGIGRGVYDFVRRYGRKARPADSRNTAEDDERYYNARAEGYWKLREQFEKGLISLPEPVNRADSNDPVVRLIRELGAIKSEKVGKKEKIKDKKEIKGQLGFSPDHADALMMTFWKPDSLFKQVSTMRQAQGVDMTGVFLR